MHSPTFHGPSIISATCMHSACARVHILKCFFKAMFFLDLRDNISMKFLQKVVQNLCPSPQEAKALGLALEPPLSLSAAWGLGHSWSSAMTKQHMLGLELLLYNIHRLPIKLTTSPSPRAGHKLLSEGRVKVPLVWKVVNNSLKHKFTFYDFGPFSTVSHSWNSFPLLWSKQPPIFI